MPDALEKPIARMDMNSRKRIRLDMIGVAEEVVRFALKIERENTNRRTIKMANQLQQGDTIWTRIKSLPVGVKEVPRINGKIIAMHGEGGHTHCISDVDAMFYEKDGKHYLTATRAVKLNHEEHNTITIEPGIWEIGQVVEKDWLSAMVRPIID